MVDKTMRELCIHGDVVFPVALYEWYGLDENGMILECHWHEEGEFFSIVEGCALFTVNGKKHLIKKNDIVFIPGNSMHMAEPYKNNPCKFRAIVFGMPLLYGLSSDIVHAKYIMPLCENYVNMDVVIFHDSANENIYAVFEKIFKIMTARLDTYEILTKAYLYELISLIWQQGDFNRPNDDSRKLMNSTHSIKKAITYIIANYEKKITISEIASIANMSTGHFSKLFKLMTSCSPVEYLINQRLSKAAVMLSESNEQIFNVAMDTGFNNVGYFIRSFKKKFNCTPYQYKKTHNVINS